MADRIALVCASNHPAVLAGNLMRSPDIGASVTDPHVITGAHCAGAAHNAGLEATDAEIAVFVHQDVYLPRGWFALLDQRIAEIEERYPDWAVIGAYGVALDGAGYGPVWSSSLSSIVGRVALGPVAVQSVDELLIVLRRASGLRFDDALPGFHLHGTDIVASARAAGLGAYAANLPLIHNDTYKDQLDASFGHAYRYMRRKWAEALPLRSPVIKISKTGHQLWRARWHNFTGRAVRQDMALDTSHDAEALARACGWADLHSCLQDQAAFPVVRERKTSSRSAS